jgi:beta-glucosidase/6-phospho-beta-glucosidase/beta-galactosidase
MHQVGGGWKAADKELSVWEAFCLMIPGRIRNNESAEIACAHYYRFKKEAQLFLSAIGPWF